MSKSQNDGKYLEERWQEALQEFATGNPSYTLRLYDAHAARGMLPAQPGDFIWTMPGAAVLVECKSTEKGEPLKKLLDKQQIAKHRLWHRAGHPSLFVYGDLTTMESHLYDGRDVVSHHLSRAKLIPFSSGPLKPAMTHVQRAFSRYAQPRSA